MQRVCQKTRLSAGAMHVLRILQRLSKASVSRELGYAFPWRESLSRETGCTVRSVSRWIAQLKRAGLVRVERAKEPGGRNHYFLLTSVGQAASLSVLPDRLAACPTAADGTPLSPPDRTPVSHPEAPALSPPVATTLSLPEGTTVAQPAEAAPLLEVSEMEKTEENEQQAPAAAGGFSLIRKAEAELLECGVEQPMARNLAGRDAALALVAVAHWRSIRAGTNPSVRPGLLVRFCQHPEDCDFRRKGSAAKIGADNLVDPFSVWSPPRKSGAMAQRDQQEKKAAKAAAKAAELRADRRNLGKEKADVERQHAAWEALDEPEQRGIVAAVVAQFPASENRPGILQTLCRQMALRLAEASADLARWQAVPEAERQAAEQLAARDWPLFAQDPQRRLWACWMALETMQRTKKGKP